MSYIEHNYGNNTGAAFNKMKINCFEDEVFYGIIIYSVRLYDIIITAILL